MAVPTIYLGIVRHLALILLAVAVLTACEASAPRPDAQSSAEHPRSRRRGTVRAHARQEGTSLLVGLEAECEPQAGKVVECGPATGVPVFLDGTTPSLHAVSFRLGITDSRGLVRVDLDKAIDPKAPVLPPTATLACAPSDTPPACVITNLSDIPAIDLKTIAAARDDRAWDASVGTCRAPTTNDACDSVKSYLMTFGTTGRHSGDAVAILGNMEKMHDEKAWAAIAPEVDRCRSVMCSPRGTACVVDTDACSNVQAYLRALPNGVHAAEGREILAAAEQAELGNDQVAQQKPSVSEAAKNGKPVALSIDDLCAAPQPAHDQLVLVTGQITVLTSLTVFLLGKNMRGASAFRAPSFSADEWGKRLRVGGYVRLLCTRIEPSSSPCPNFLTGCVPR